MIDGLAIVIPARMASTRFPGKPLFNIAGKPMIQWVFEACVKSNIASAVIVATPDLEIAEVVQKFGGRSELTRSDHMSGTDRIAELADRLEFESYVNVQGDEPLISRDSIEACAKTLVESREEMTSVFCECQPHEIDDPSVVKVVMDLKGFALYFSRHPIPFNRSSTGVAHWRHLGVYGYTKSLLKRFAEFRSTPLETAESLEQLRFLEHGVRIKMARGEATGVSVDLPSQAELVRKILERA